MHYISVSPLYKHQSIFADPPVRLFSDGQFSVRY
ncbi:unnamed protein product [Acanthoscelides obtectus]|uniref:Uncharacterized protein n=1 Tax=Acanthoscelides obtectus TaxID=200917 RepID=A0A9P0LPY8_ACAOB|nr:unnamed protein product [Acanthoscelides obtectus]CAK1651511.1 hypothetical protein AOBTE_LOCUS17325 [Acanthoscelides obtectus]